MIMAERNLLLNSGTGECEGMGEDKVEADGGVKEKNSNDLLRETLTKFMVDPAQIDDIVAFCMLAGWWGPN